MDIKTIITIAVLLLLAPAGYCSFAASDEKINTETEKFIHFGYDLFEKNTSKPEKDIIETTTNKHNPAQTDEWHTVYYDGLIAKFYRAKSAPKDLLRQIIVTNKKINLPLGIRIGTTKEAILEKLGKPSKETGNELYYNGTSESYEESVTIKIAGGVLIEVQWDYEID